MGGLLTLPAFVETFPQIDVVNTTGAAAARASQIQGTSSFAKGGRVNGVATEPFVGRRQYCYLRDWMFSGSIVYLVGNGLLRETKDDLLRCQYCTDASAFSAYAPPS